MNIIAKGPKATKVKRKSRPDLNLRLMPSSLRPMGWYPWPTKDHDLRREGWY